MQGFIPHMFIGVGAKNCYFTLRETYLHTTYIRGAGEFGNASVNGVYQGSSSTEIWSFHHKNLSQNLDEAIAKATEFAKENGVPLKFDRASLDQEMQEIKRANAEERARRVREAEEREEEYKTQQDAKLAQQRKLISEDKIPFGQYLGKSFSDVPLGYLNWLMNGDFEEGTVIYDLKMRLLNNHKHLQLPKPDQTKTVGTVGKRMDFEVTVIKSAHFCRYNSYSYRDEVVFITTMVTADNECLVCFSGGFNADVGEKLKIKATVKAHSEHEGQAQTIVQRVKVI